MNDLIKTSVEDRVLSVVLNRPEKKNALTLGMYETLTSALIDAESDAKIRVVLISGAGGSFTAGNDLFDFLNDPPSDETSPVFRFLRAISTFPKPLLAAVEGHAVGIGTTMLLHCDLVYAAPSATFQLPFVNLGLVPEAASSFLLPRTIGLKRASELLLSGDTFSAEKAFEFGLINEIVSSENVLNHAHDRAATLAQKPPRTIRLAKHLLRFSDMEHIEAAIAREGNHFVDALSSPEAQEALSAFIEKRKPDFSAFD